MHVIIQDGVCAAHVGYRNFETKMYQLLFEGRVFDTAWREVGPKGLLSDLAKDLTRLSSYNGFFSGVLIDKKKKEFRLFTDRCAVHDLYYHIDDDRIMVSDRAFELIRLGLAPVLDDRTVASRLMYGCGLSQDTYFQGINIIRPGKAVVIDHKNHAVNVCTDRYYMRGLIDDRPDSEIVRDLQERITDAVRNMCGNISREYVFTLTGGLDSRLVAAVASKSGMPLKGVCLDNDGGYDEERISREVGYHLDRIHSHS